MVSIPMVWLATGSLVVSNIIGAFLITGDYAQLFYGTVWLVTQALFLTWMGHVSRAEQEGGR